MAENYWGSRRDRGSGSFNRPSAALLGGARREFGSAAVIGDRVFVPGLETGIGTIAELNEAAVVAAAERGDRQAAAAEVAGFEVAAAEMQLVSTEQQ